MPTHGRGFEAKCPWDEYFLIVFGVDLKCRTYCLEQYDQKSHRKYVAQADLADFVLEDAQGSCTFD